MFNKSKIRIKKIISTLLNSLPPVRNILCIGVVVLISYNFNTIDLISKENDNLYFVNLTYILYQTELGDEELDDNKFQNKRSYITFKKILFKHISFRITVDAIKDDFRDCLARLKYVCAHNKLDNVSFVSKPDFEFSQIHTPRFDFDEHFNYTVCRIQYLERAGLFNS